MRPLIPYGERAHPGALLADRVAADAARPLLTFYDDATGERVELSGATLDNWVAKTANLLVDELGVSAGELVAVALPLHWQTAVVLLGAWRVGCVVELLPVVAGPCRLVAPGATIARQGPEARVAFVAEELLGQVPAEDEVGLSLAPLGRGLAAAVPLVIDYAVDVRSQGDRFSGAMPGGGAVALLRDGAAEVTGAELMAEAQPYATAKRVLTALPLHDRIGLAAGLLGPLAGGGSVVMCVNLDPAALQRRIATEQVDEVLG